MSSERHIVEDSPLLCDPDVSSNQKLCLTPGVEEPVVVLYWYRWLFLAIYFFITAANNMLLTTFGAVDVATAQCFNQSALAVNSMAGSFAFTGVVLLLPGVIVLKQLGFRKASLSFPRSLLLGSSSSFSPRR